MELQEIKSRLTLAQVLGFYGLKPDKYLRLHCPFHRDKTPSLQVYYKTHTAYCFSSNCKTHGKSMDVVDFVMYMEGCTKHESMEKCKRMIEGELPKPSQTEATRESFLEKMFTYFRNAVHNSKPAQEYLRQRGLDPLKMEVGYNTAQFHHGARKDEALIQHCVAVGLLSPWGTNTREGGQAYKPFAKYCIVFALRNAHHQVSGLYFRSTLNDAEQRHFYLKDRKGLYPGYPSPGTKKLILTESIIDAATLLQIPAITEQYSVLALYGTNGLSLEHIASIESLPELEEIILWLNADEAGKSATAKHAATLHELLPDIRITTVALPDGEDVNSMAQSHADMQVFVDLIDTRTDFFFSNESSTEDPIEKKKSEPQAQLFIEQPSPSVTPSETPMPPNSSLDTSNPYKLRYATDTAVYYVQGGISSGLDQLKIMLVVEHPITGLKSRNKVDLYEEKQVEKLCKDVSEKLSLRSDLLAGDLYRLTDLLETYREESQQKPETTNNIPVLTIKERTELEGFLKQPGLTKKLNDLLGKSGIVGEERNRIFLLLIAISHKMPETLHALIQGSSGSGKTRLLKQISDCMPPESVTKLTRLSDKVLYNFPEHYFVNRLLSLEDIDGLSEEAEFAFRELQSNGELNSATSIKLDNGQITSGQKTVRGPIASLACTTRGEIYEDNMSRVFLLAVDESAAQTKRIIEYQNCVAAGAINKEEEEQTKGFIQQLVRILQPYKVVNPHAGKIQLPEEAHKIRRLNDLFQGFVKMVTILHQYQRRKDDKGRLVTEISDIETAVHIMFESIVLKVDELDGSLRQFFERLKAYLQKQHGKNYETATFSLREIRQALKYSKMQVFRYVQDLQQLEYLRQSGGYANRGYQYQVQYWDNYTAMRERIRDKLDKQLEGMRKERTPAGMLHQ
jgi:DNA primase